MATDTVLITGCSSGIGRAAAQAFLAEDWTVYATARNPADVEALGEAGAELATLDVTDVGDVARVVDRVVDEQGSIECLVNNAGYGQLGAIEDVPVDAVRRQFDVNVFGPHRLTRAVLPHMREAGDGTIVNVSSFAGRLAYPGNGVYCGSKFALEAMTDALRNEVDEHGVDAVLVEPGLVNTPFTDRVASEVEPGEDDADLERSGAYEWFYDVLDDTVALGDARPLAVSAERVADDIVNVASATKPPARVPVGTLARVLILSRFLPDSVRDGVYSLARRLVR